MRNFKTYSKKMQKINQLIIKSAETDANILIIGDRGVGKSSCAKRIHSNSLRNSSKLVEVTPSALKKSKNESYLYVAIQEALGGTLFIDDVEMLTDKEQTLLLNSVSISPQPFRLIVSSTKSLENYVRTGKLKEELYNRLCVFKIRLPNLRDRKEDIPYLIDYFTQEFGQKYNKQKQLSDEVFTKLSEKTWPGNILELENIIEYAFIHSQNDIINLEDLPVWLDRENGTSGEGISGQLFDIAAELISQARLTDTYMAFEEYKKLVLPPVLKASVSMTGGNKSKAAELLGINRNTLKKMIREYNIEN